MKEPAISSKSGCKFACYNITNLIFRHEELERCFRTHGVNAFFKPQNTLRQLVCKPKDPTKKEDVCGPIYHIACEGAHGVDCDSVYIGETERTLKARFSEHRRPSCTSSDVSRHLHQDCPGHKITLDQVSILDRDSRWFERGVKEAIHIRANDPDLIRDRGRFQLPYVWDNIFRSRVPQASDLRHHVQC